MARLECLGKHPKHDMSPPHNEGDEWVDGSGRTFQPKMTECTRTGCRFFQVIDGDPKRQYTGPR